MKSTQAFTKAEFLAIAQDNEQLAAGYYHDWKYYTVGGYLLTAAASYRHYKERTKAAKYARKRAKQVK